MKTTNKHGRGSDSKRTTRRGQEQAGKQQVSEKELKHVAGGARHLPRGRAASKVYEPVIDPQIKVY